jgi:hypothetical protein
MRRLFLLLPLFLFFCLPLTLSARTIVVPTDSPTIQGGIDMVVDGDTVMVLPGIYWSCPGFMDRGLFGVESLSA